MTPTGEPPNLPGPETGWPVDLRRGTVLHAIIEQPATLAGLTIEPSLIERIAGDDKPIVELAHEAVIREWGLLRQGWQKTTTSWPGVATLRSTTRRGKPAPGDEPRTTPSSCRAAAPSTRRCTGSSCAETSRATRLPS